MIEPFIFKGPTDKLTGAWHKGYPIVMARLLAALKNTEDSVVELGTDGGWPLIAYGEWFQNARKVIGIDISPTPECVQSQSQIEHWQRDAYTMDTIAKLRGYGRFAFLCDDGSHQLGHQEFFVEHYVPLLSEDGIAIVEDLQRPEHVAALHAKLPQGFMGYAIDLRISDSRYDSHIFVAHRIP